MTRPEIGFSTDLFEEGRRAMILQPGAMLLGGFAACHADGLLADLGRVDVMPPFRAMLPRAEGRCRWLTNWGSVGWVTDRTA